MAQSSHYQPNMHKTLRLILIIGLALGGTTVFADNGPSSLSYTERLPKGPIRKMPSIMSVTLLGQIGVNDNQDPGTEPGGNLEEASAHGDSSMAAGLLFELGNGPFSIQAGFQSLSFPLTVTTKGADDQQKSYNLKTSNQYWGLPVFLKYNYIESPRQIFSVKIGLIPTYLSGGSKVIDTANSNGVQLTPVTVNSQDLMYAAGITGSAPMFMKASLVVDLTFLRSSSDAASDGSRNQTLLLGAGLLFFL